MESYKLIYKKLNTPVCLCALVGMGYMYMLKEYFKLEYRIYREKKDLINNDADPNKLNMTLLEQLLEKRDG